GTGTVTGTVRDSNKAVVPGAELQITNTTTNISYPGRTNDVGIYVYTALPRGSYTLTVQMQGFKKWSGTLELLVGQTAVVDPVLELGSLDTTVEVTGAAPPITLASGEISDVKDYQRIRQLPLNGRSVTALFDLTPGVEGGGNARVNGLKVG